MDTWCVRRPVRDLRPGDHAWLAYAGEEERRHVIGAFIGEGLAVGDRVICLSDGDPAGLPGVRPARDDAAIRRHLVVIPPAACRAEGDLDPERTVALIRGEIERAERDGYRSVRITAEMTWAVGEPGGSRLVAACERRFDAVIGPSVTVTAICQIDRRRCPPEALAALAGMHPVLVQPNPEFEDMVLRITRTFQPYGLSLGGELDASRHAVFTEALNSVIVDGDGHSDRDGVREAVHLDLAELEFMDLGALTLMAKLAATCRELRPIVLDHVPPQLTAVIGAVGWRMLPGLRPGNLARPGPPGHGAMP